MIGFAGISVKILLTKMEIHFFVKTVHFNQDLLC